jgi:hypothetical protein
LAKGFLRIVSDKGEKPKRTYAGQPLECRCGSRTTVETRIGRTIKNGKVSAGQKQIVCYHCKTVLWG